MELLNFFDQKSKDFYERGILSLLERWRQVIDQGGKADFTRWNHCRINGISFFFLAL